MNTCEYILHTTHARTHVHAHKHTWKHSQHCFGIRKTERHEFKFVKGRESSRIAKLGAFDMRLVWGRRWQSFWMGQTCVPSPCSPEDSTNDSPSVVLVSMSPYGIVFRMILKTFYFKEQRKSTWAFPPEETCVLSPHMYTNHPPGDNLGIISFFSLKTSGIVF